MASLDKFGDLQFDTFGGSMDAHIMRNMEGYYDLCLNSASRGAVKHRIKKPIDMGAYIKYAKEIAKSKDMEEPTGDTLKEWARQLWMAEVKVTFEQEVRSLMEQFDFDIQQLIKKYE
jgi:hypothetical protein